MLSVWGRVMHRTCPNVPVTPGCFFPGSQDHTLVQECDRLWMFVYPREYKGKIAHLAAVRDRKDALRDPNCGH